MEVQWFFKTTRFNRSRIPPRAITVYLQPPIESFNYHFTRHLGMDRAEIVVCSRLPKLEAVVVVRIQCLGAERAVVAHYGMRNIVAVHPRHFGAYEDGDTGIRECEVIDLDLRRRRLSLGFRCVTALR